MHDFLTWFSDPFQYAFMQRALLAVAMVSVVSAVIGSFVVLKGLAFIGDALAHASFAGVAVAFVLGGSIYLGAVIAAIATAMAIGYVGRRARLSLDTAIGIIFVACLRIRRRDNQSSEQLHCGPVQLRLWQRPGCRAA